MRAMLFERLVHDQQFISELMTKGVGLLGLERPAAVTYVECRRNERRTVQVLHAAHVAAASDGIATMVIGARMPIAGFEGRGGTPVLPDFMLVVRRPGENGAAVGSWLIAGDAKDYERIRARIDDARLLKGFLQVALGAESADRWSVRPAGMEVHRSGILAVPRSAYLRPLAVVEQLDDHRREVRVRLAQRIELGAELRPGEDGVQVDRVVGPLVATAIEHIEADFDPARCVTCSLFAYCRDVLRHSTDPIDLMTEIGIERPYRVIAAGLVEDSDAAIALPERVARSVVATVSGRPQWTVARRTDPAGESGTVNVVLVKADSAALGVNGVAVQAVGEGGQSKWREAIFHEPRTPFTRMRILSMIGEALRDVMGTGQVPRTVHVCLPDGATADLLATMADSVAGVEISRLRWQRDIEQAREPLTFDGQPATLPDPLPPVARLAASFLLDEDRARAFAMRSPVVILQRAVQQHLVAGGPWSDSGRLDYLVEWGEATTRLEHRTVSDVVAARISAPGARMTNGRSNELHAAEQAQDWITYDTLVRRELEFRRDAMGRAIELLQARPVSRLREVFAEVEAAAQEVWHRRLALQASDLVRFSLTNRRWRNDHVRQLESDRRCSRTVSALADAGVGQDLAGDAGNREFFTAEVIAQEPLVLRSSARALADGMILLAVHVDDAPEVERPGVDLKSQKGSFKFTGLLLGPIGSTGEAGTWAWHPALPATWAVGTRLVVADVEKIGKSLRNGLDFSFERPHADESLAPRPSCVADSYALDPVGHRWCCQSHEAAAAEYSDELAARRARGELNPEVWPPIIDVESFEIPGDESLEDGRTDGIGTPPDGLTMDDLE